jgi:hypothetical protein
MRVVAYILAVACALLGIVYFMIPGGGLPEFLPGYDKGSTHIHTTHGVAAITGAIVFLLIGLSTRRQKGVPQ